MPTPYSRHEDERGETAPPHVPVGRRVCECVPERRVREELSPLVERNQQEHRQSEYTTDRGCLRNAYL
jgi:hypothetical protein